MATRTRPPYNPHGDLTPGERARDRAQAYARFPRQTAKADGPKPFVIKNPDAPATDPQKTYIHGLLDQLAKVDTVTWGTALDWFVGIPGPDGNLHGGVKADMTMDLAHRTIDRLKARIEEAKGRGTPMSAVDAVVTATPVDLFVDVPDGYYAMDPDGLHRDPGLRFYRVSTPRTRGGIGTQGWRKVQIQAGPNWHPVGRLMRDAVLSHLRGHVDEASKRYADELGRCNRCNLELTDAESRAAGRGPICRNK
jgi:hypothetical protein